MVGVFCPTFFWALQHRVGQYGDKEQYQKASGTCSAMFINKPAVEASFFYVDARADAICGAENALSFSLGGGKFL